MTMRSLVFSFAFLVSLGCSGASSEEPRAETPPTTTEPATTPEPAPAIENEPTEPASSGGALCGTRGAAQCGAGTFCDFAAGSNCGADDRGGHCAPIPSVCTREYNPVCGCDGQTHPTACTAHADGVAVAHDGPC